MSQPTPSPAAVDPFTPDPRLLVRWFVQFNPMFTASALCVLGGVLVLARSMGDGFDLALTAVVELYQWLLIGTAALLSRRLLDHRPAVILGLIALVFLVDPTLQVSAMATANHGAATVVWVLAFGLKLHALVWAFRLRLNPTARILPIVGAAVVAALPNARLMLDSTEAMPGVMAVGTFLLGAIAIIVPPRVTCRRVLGEVGEVMFPRLLRAAAAIGIAGALFQGANATFAFGPQAVLPTVGALLLVAAVAVRHETWTWFFAGLGFIFMAGPGGLPMVAVPLTALALLAAARHHPPRFIVAGVVLAALPSALMRSGAGMEVDVVIVIVACAALGGVLWIRRGWSAVPGIAVLVARSVSVWVVPAAAAQSGGTWGAALVLSGFALLPLGVVAHRRLSRSLARDDARAAAAADLVTGPDGLPSTSMAIGV